MCRAANGECCATSNLGRWRVYGPCRSFGYGHGSDHITRLLFMVANMNKNWARLAINGPSRSMYLHGVATTFGDPAVAFPVMYGSGDCPYRYISDQ